MRQPHLLKYASKARALPTSLSITESWRSEKDLRTFGSRTKQEQCSSQNPTTDSSILAGRTTRPQLRNYSKSMGQRRIASPGSLTSLQRRLTKPARLAERLPGSPFGDSGKPESTEAPLGWSLLLHQSEGGCAADCSN